MSAGFAVNAAPTYFSTTNLTTLISERISTIDALREAIDRLPEREAYILAKRVGFDDGLPRTHEEIGRHLDLGPTRVRSLEKQALSRLRHPAFGLRQEDDF